MLGDREYMRDDWSGSGYMSGRGGSSAVKKLIIINVIVYFIQYLTLEVQTQYTTGYTVGGLTSYLWLSVKQLPEVWRFGTYMFVHGDLMHLFFNMWSLYIFGKPVENRIGSFEFMKLYFLSGFIGAAGWLIFNPGSISYLVGASGAIFGVMAAAALFFPDMQILLIFPPVVLRLKTLVICLGIIQILMLNQSNSNIAYLAHLGGLFGGYYFVRKYLRSSQPSMQSAGGNSFSSYLSNIKKMFSQIPKSGGPDLQFVTDEDELDDEESINAKIDPILDKIGKFGIKSLTSREQQLLDRTREKLKNRK